MARTIFTAMIDGKESKFKLKDGKFYRISPSGAISTRPHTGQGLLQLKSAAQQMQGSSTKQMMDYYDKTSSKTKATVSSTGAGTAKKRPGPEIKKKTSKANRATSQGGRSAAEVQREREKAMFPYEYKTTGSDALSTEKLKRTAYSERKPTTPSSATGRKRTKYKTDVKDKGVPVPPKKPTESGRIKKDEFSALMDTVTKPRGTVDQSKKRPPAQESTPTSTQARVRTKQAKRITAGPNVGFGPKGNIFPSNAAERRELMAKYGGTGSAAAKAAAAGRQGNLTKKAAKGGYMKKSKSSMDYRKGGMVMSTVDNRRKR